MSSAPATEVPPNFITTISLSGDISRLRIGAGAGVEPRCGGAFVALCAL
jgi:hypothetical protein